MKRRLLSMALCLLMLASSFTLASCGEEDDLSDVGADAVASAMTLTIWGIKDEGTTDEAIAMVEEAMSKITQAQFNTAVKLNLLTEDEYDKALEAKMDEIQEKLDLEAAEAEAKKQAEKEAKKNQANGETTTAGEESSAEESSELADETILNEYGMVETLYPEIEDDQLDIFLMTDYAMFKKYSDKGVLMALDEQLSAGSKILKSYIHPTILAAGKVGKTTYAIPTNQPIGEYTYMLLNKDLMDEYYYDADNFTSFNSTKTFLQDIMRNEKIDAFAGDISPVGINYFTKDGSKSMVGAMLPPNSGASEDGAPASLLDSDEWVEYITIVKELESNKAIGPETIEPGDDFGVGIIKCSPAEVEAFAEDYYINVLQYPTATTENVYNGMFAVSTYTKNVQRSMEIITYLNTRSDLRNLFGYGIEGVHYELDEEGVVKTLSDDYNMNLAYTGNMYVAYPPEGSTADVWEVAKAQNIDMVTSPWFGFSWDEAQLDPDIVAGVASLSSSLYRELDRLDFEELEDWLDEAEDEIDDDEDVQAFIATEVEKTEDADKDEDAVEIVPMGKLYADWFAAAAK